MDVDLATVVTDADRDAYLAVRNGIQPCNPYTQDELTHRWDQAPAMLALVARRAGLPIGYGYAELQHWMTDATSVVGDIGVLPHARGHGIGTSLYRAVSDWAREQERTGLDVVVGGMAGSSGSVYWERRQFAEIFRESESAIDLTEAAIPPVSLPNGVRLVTLAERGDLDETVYAVAREAVADSPAGDGDRFDAGDIDHWREGEFRAPAVVEECTIIALTGDDVAIGYASLWRMHALPGTALHGFTGVARGWRGRGIGSALKHEQLRRARATGFTTVRTQNAEANLPMLAINRRLGYRHLHTVRVLRGPLG